MKSIQKPSTRIQTSQSIHKWSKINWTKDGIQSRLNTLIINLGHKLLVETFMTRAIRYSKQDQVLAASEVKVLLRWTSTHQHLTITPTNTSDPCKITTIIAIGSTSKWIFNTKTISLAATTEKAYPTKICTVTTNKIINGHRETMVKTITNLVGAAGAYRANLRVWRPSTRPITSLTHFPMGLIHSIVNLKMEWLVWEKTYRKKLDKFTRSTLRTFIVSRFKSPKSNWLL